MDIHIKFTPAPSIASPVPSITSPTSPTYDYVDKQILLDDQGRVYQYSKEMGVPIPFPPGTIYQNGKVYLSLEDTWEIEKG